MNLIITGGGSGEDTRDIDLAFASKLDKEKPLLYIPIAIDNIKHPYPSCLEWLKSTFEEMGLSREYENMINIYSYLRDNFNVKTYGDITELFAERKINPKIIELWLDEEMISLEDSVYVSAGYPEYNGWILESTNEKLDNFCNF
jgi:hypothetical protein